MSTEDADRPPLAVPVLVDGWQYECCGEPPVVGRRVSWRLGLRAADPPLPVVDLEVEIERLGDDVLAGWRALGNRTGPDPGVARREGLTVFLTDVGAVEGSRLRGLLAEDRHVDVPTPVPPTAGTIERVWLVSWDHDDGVGDGWHPVPGSARLVEVDAAPAYLPWELPADGATRWRTTGAVLVQFRPD